MILSLFSHESLVALCAVPLSLKCLWKLFQYPDPRILDDALQVRAEKKTETLALRRVMKVKENYDVGVRHALGRLSCRLRRVYLPDPRNCHCCSESNLTNVDMKESTG